jgi:hypothetical protein
MSTKVKEDKEMEILSYHHGTGKGITLLGRYIMSHLLNILKPSGKFAYHQV